MKPRHWKNYINGAWVNSSEHRQVVNPADGSVVGTVAMATISDANSALNASAKCFASGHWSRIKPIDRTRVLLKIADEIYRISKQGGALLCAENGKRIDNAIREFTEAARYFEYYAMLCERMSGAHIPMGDDFLDFTTYEPFGVTVQIIPWNFPASLVARSLAPALACGNSAVVKSAELTPISAAVIFQAIEKAGLPDGCANLICADGATVGDYLCKHPQTRQIVFTGSIATGRSIMRAATEQIVPTIMELGGKSAGIAFADCDQEQLVASVKSGVFFNSGQVCSAMSRLLVDRSIYNEVLADVKNMAENLVVGAGSNNADITPLISREQLNKVERFCNRAAADGAKILCGAKRLDDLEGHYFAPTIFYDVDPQSEIAQEEVFGPVLCMMPFDTEQQAIDIANNTRFGLVSGVFSQNINRAIRVSRLLDSGQVFINEWFAGGIESPFGGNKQSGFGREKGEAAMLSYVRIKNTAARILPS